MFKGQGLGRIAAPLFVLIWSTGFVGAKYGLPYAEPMTFLALRFALATVAFVIWAQLAGEFRREGGFDFAGAALVGVLIHGCYLGGVFTSIWLGAGAALASLIVGLQPVVTAILARIMLGEALTPRRQLGLALGLGGVGLVVISKAGSGEMPLAGIILCTASLFAISIGSVIQKRRKVAGRLAADSAVQYAAALAFAALISFGFETREVNWTPEFTLALSWMVGGLSIGAISLYYLLLRRGEASQTASLFSSCRVSPPSWRR